MIDIDKNSALPVHQQIMEGLKGQMKTGALAKGDKLPAERALADALGVARGTVKQAYDGLIAQGYAMARQGSGTFACYAGENFAHSPMRAVDKLLEQLADMGMDLQEVLMLLKSRMLHKSKEQPLIHLAAVDCNPETLGIMRHQLGDMEGIGFMSFLLKDVYAFKYPQDIFESFDIIFTTSTHYNDLKAFIPQCGHKIAKAVVSVDRETLVKLAGITAVSQVSVLTRSKRFANIIRNNLAALHLQMHDEDFHLLGAEHTKAMAEILQNKQTLILPPSFALSMDKGISEEILRFHKQGGEVITFNYIIERGSLIYLEEKIGQARELSLAKAGL